MKLYLKDNVYEAAIKRINRIYDEFDNVIVSFSGGKDSTVILELTLEVARARGKHSVDGMSNIVLQMLKNGWDDAAICNELGLETEELVRLKYVTGFAKLYEGKQFSQAWETTNQVNLRNEYLSNSKSSGEGQHD